MRSTASWGGGRRGRREGGGGRPAEARVLSTFLNEMDGVDVERDDGVLVLAATNRPGSLDAALMRPGRFDEQIYAGPPDKEGREQVLRIHVKSGEVRELLDFGRLAALTEGFTGAEIEGCCREGLMRMVARDIEEIQGGRKGEGGGGEGEREVGGREEVMGYFVDAVRNANPILKRGGSEEAEWEVFRREAAKRSYKGGGG